MRREMGMTYGSDTSRKGHSSKTILYLEGSLGNFDWACLIPKLTWVIDVKNLFNIFTQWGLAGD